MRKNREIDVGERKKETKMKKRERDRLACESEIDREDLRFKKNKKEIEVGERKRETKMEKKKKKKGEGDMCGCECEGNLT